MFWRTNIVVFNVFAINLTVSQEIKIQSEAKLSHVLLSFCYIYFKETVYKRWL